MPHATYLPQDESAAIRAWIMLMKRAYSNGDVVFRSFRLDGMAPDWWQGFDRATYSGGLTLPPDFWETAGLRENLPDLGEVKPEWRQALRHEDLFFGAAWMGRTLHLGGAYTPPANAAELRRDLTVSQTAALDMAEGEAPAVFIGTGAWCDFFHDVAWDFSLVMLLPVRRKLKLLLATDTD